MNYDKAICELKTVFMTEIHASDAAKFMQSKLRLIKKIQAYACPYCGMWHLTSTGKGRRRAFTVPSARKLIRSEAEFWIKRKGWDKEEVKPKQKVKRYRF